MKLEVDVTIQLGAFHLKAAFQTDSGLTALFGPSGSGKTTLINIIAGLLRPDRGRVAVNGRVLVDTERRVFLAKHRRRLGYVFQEPRLFPHLTVRQNLNYGRWFTPSNERTEAFDHIVELLGIGSLLDRGPVLLSGGEKQRVAIGRALLASPHLLLMDEPLAALDEARKAEIFPYIERLRDQSRIPIVYVSHSVSEVARLANSMVLMSEGSIVATGSMPDMMSHMDLSSSALSADVCSVLEMQVVDCDEKYGRTLLRSGAGELRIAELRSPVGATLRVRIRASDVVLALKASEALDSLNVLSGRIAEIGTHDGALVNIRVDLNGESLLARVTRFTLDRLELTVGQPVFAIIKTAAINGEGVGRFRS